MITKPHHPEPRTVSSKSLLLFMLFFTVFAVSTFLLIEYLNIISGEAVGDSGSVQLRILESEAVSSEEGAARARLKGKSLLYNLEVEPSEIKLTLQPGSQHSFAITLRNVGSDDLHLYLSTDVSLLDISEPELILPPGAERRVTLLIDRTQEHIALGTLTIEGISAFKQLRVFLIIRSPEKPFSLDVAIPASFKHRLPGQPLSATISLTPAPLGRSLSFTYLVKNEKNQIVFEEREKTPALTQSSFQKTLILPSSLTYGTYYLFVQTTIDDALLENADDFSLVSATPGSMEYPEQIYRQSPLFFFLIILAILFLHVLMTWRKKR